MRSCVFTFRCHGVLSESDSNLLRSRIKVKQMQEDFKDLRTGTVNSI